VEERDQLQLVREFMLAIAPVVTRHSLHAIEAPDPAANARMTLEWAMHLATQYGTCHDMFYVAENTPQTAHPIKARLEAAAALKRETSTPAPGIQ
jgi:hypothetical protein